MAVGSADAVGKDCPLGGCWGRWAWVGGGGSCGNKVQVVAAIVVEPSIFISLRSTNPDLPNS